MYKFQNTGPIRLDAISTFDLLYSAFLRLLSGEFRSLGPSEAQQGAPTVPAGRCLTLIFSHFKKTTFKIMLKAE